jgi:hypothetical protein
MYSLLTILQVFCLSVTKLSAGKLYKHDVTFISQLNRYGIIEEVSSSPEYAWKFNCVPYTGAKHVVT